MRSRKRLPGFLLAALGIVAGMHAAAARPIGEVCAAIAHEANRAGRALQQGDVADFSDMLIAAVPSPMHYLQSRSLRSADFYAMFDCHDAASCRERYGEGLGAFLENDDDSSPWRTQMVDTRPDSNEVFVFTSHTGQNRADRLSVFEQQVDRTWKLLPFGFGEMDAVADDSGFAVLLDGFHPYAVVPPGRDGFAELREYLGSDFAITLRLAVHDPWIAQVSCAVAANLSSRPTVAEGADLLQMEPKPPLRRLIRAYLDRHLAAIAAKTRFDYDLGERLSSAPIFVPSTVSSGALARLQAMLSEPKARDTLQAQKRAVAASALKPYWDLIESHNRPEDWETRWFAVDIAHQGYVGMLLRFAGSIMERGSQQFSPALVALFSLEGASLKPVAVYEVQSEYRFTGAEVAQNP